MKNLTKFLFACLCIGLVFTSCNTGSDVDYDELLEQQRILDSIVKRRIQDQFPVIKQYAEENLTAPQFIDSLGVAYEVLAQGDGSYTYYINSAGSLVYPTATVKYTGRLVETGDVFDETTDDETAQFSLNSVISAWQHAFFPNKINYNGSEVVIGGITSNGLTKGSKIRIVVPSVLTYGDNDQKDSSGNVKIPGQSPLDFTIDVVNVQ